MRKRLVIGAIAAVVIGVAAYVLSQPRKGTVQWHKKEYLRATRQPLRIHAQNLWQYLRGKPERWYSTDLASDDEREEHQRKLIQLGYLIECEFVVSNDGESVVYEAAQIAAKDPRSRSVQHRFLDLDYYFGTNVVRVVARPNDLTLFRESIRRADASKAE